MGQLKRLLPTLSRKDKGARTRTSWYAECGADAAPAHTSTSSWYAEAGLYQAGNISTSSGASSGSHPASPLPHSLFTHEPLYQFYNAAKVEAIFCVLLLVCIIKSFDGARVKRNTEEEPKETEPAPAPNKTTGGGDGGGKPETSHSNGAGHGFANILQKPKDFFGIIKKFFIFKNE